MEAYYGHIFTSVDLVCSTYAILAFGLPELENHSFIFQMAEIIYRINIKCSTPCPIPLPGCQTNLPAIEN